MFCVLDDDYYFIIDVIIIITSSIIIITISIINYHDIVFIITNCMLCIIQDYNIYI